MLTAASATSASANPEARSAITGEARLGHARRVAAAVMLRRDLDVFALLATVSLAIFDPQVGEMELFIEVGKVVLVCPFADLFVRPIGMAVVVGAVAIPLVQPALVLTLELVVEHDAVDVRTAFRQALRGAFVGAIDLEVVFELPFAFDAMPERLAVTLIAVAMVFEQAPAVPRKRDRMLARARHSNGLNQSLFAQMSQVA